VSVFRFLNFFVSNPGTKLLVMIGKCRQHEEARLLYEIMQSDGLKPTIDVYTALVSAYGQSGQLDKAFSAVAEMKPISECKPDVYAYSVLLICCIKLHCFEHIRGILAEMS
jgi:pentatricopeptide repeat protein